LSRSLAAVSPVRAIAHSIDRDRIANAACRRERAIDPCQAAAAIHPLKSGIPPFGDETMTSLRIFATTAGILLLSPALAVAQEVPRQGYYGGHMWGDGMWGGMIFGPLLMIFYIALLVGVIVIVVRWLSGSSLGGHLPSSQARSSALDILKERFARGEIDKDEFDERRRVLES
jgi:putative membrane protein